MTKFTKRYKGKEFVKSHDCLHPKCKRNINNKQKKKNLFSHQKTCVWPPFQNLLSHWRLFQLNGFSSTIDDATNHNHFTLEFLGAEVYVRECKLLHKLPCKIHECYNLQARFFLWYLQCIFLLNCLVIKWRRVIWCKNQYQEWDWT